MFRKFISILLFASLLIGVIGGIPGWAEGAGMTASENAVNLLKSFEGFSKYPYYDYSQYSVGYGTRCPDEDYARFARDGITEEEAEALLRTYLEKTEKVLNDFAASRSLSWNQNQFDALVLFSYNCGTAWLYQSGDFRNAVILGKTGNDLIYPMSLWCSANGTIMDSLVNRRLCEANLYINGVYSTERPENYCFVKYNAQGGVAETRIEGYDASLGLSPRSKANYGDREFLGWFTEKTGGTRVTLLDTSVNGKTLYAQWKSTAQNEATVPTTPSTSTAPTTPSEPAETEKKQVTVTVTAELLNVRSGAGTANSIVGTLNYGSKITVTEAKISGGQKWGKYSGGWVCLAYTTYDAVLAGAEDPAITEKVSGEVYNTNNLRIRSGPGFSYSVEGYLSGGTKVEISLQQEADGTIWGKIPQGWISMDYVKLAGEETQPPAEPAVPESSTPPQEEKDQTGWVINSSYLNVRSGPGFSYAVVGKLYTGDQVKITAIHDADDMKWGKIDSGWVSMDYIRLDTQEEKPTENKPEEKEPISGVVYNAQNLRIRSGPGTDYSILGYITGGTAVSITEIAQGSGSEWGKISQGWISMDYVKLVEETPEEKPTEQETVEPEKPAEPEKPTSPEASEKVQVGTVFDAGYLNVRSGPGLSYPSVGGKTNGDRVEIREVRQADGMDWGHIDSGWISMDYVKLDAPETAPQSGKTMTVTADYLNVRSGAGLGFAVVNGLDEGTKITIYEETSADGLAWGKTDLGWVCMRYVK